MKTKQLRCKDLGGPCEEIISGSTFAEMGNNCKQHVMECMAMGDDAHIAAAEAMSQATPAQQQAKFAEYQQRFEAAEEVEV